MVTKIFLSTKKPVPLVLSSIIIATQDKKYEILSSYVGSSSKKSSGISHDAISSQAYVLSLLQSCLIELLTIAWVSPFGK